jgi:hypothetical protein
VRRCVMIGGPGDVRWAWGWRPAAGAGSDAHAGYGYEDGDVEDDGGGNLSGAAAIGWARRPQCSAERATKVRSRLVDMEPPPRMKEWRG